MKRAPIVLAATVAGVAATLGFKPHSSPAPAAVSTTSGSTSSASSSSSSGRTVTSDVVSTQYGNVQLKVTISGSKITGVQAIQLPSGDGKSAQISSYAEPQLRQSALTKQSASIDAVSGATYTSDGYKTALQSALDKAGVHASATGTSSAG